MAKYRHLSQDELKSMEKEFIDFLVLNGITGEDWVKLKKERPDRAEGICESFSDVVFTKILKQARYIERHTPKEVIAIFCDAQKMSLLGIEAPDHLDIDFTKPKDFETLQKSPPEGLLSLSSQKSYSQSREDEIWALIQNGFFISNQKLYMALFTAQHKN